MQQQPTAGSYPIDRSPIPQPGYNMGTSDCSRDLDYSVSSGGSPVNAPPLYNTPSHSTELEHWQNLSPNVLDDRRKGAVVEHKAGYR